MSFMQTYTYNPATERVVPKDAVVLDLDKYDGQKFASILRAILRGEGKGGFSGPWARVAAEVADQIEAQTKPRIPEPGLWGVVKDGEGRRYVRETMDEFARAWNPLGSKTNVNWEQIVAPVLVREGVES